MYSARMKRFHVITIFPDIVTAYAGESIVARAVKDKLIAIKAYNPRDFLRGKSKNGYRPVDDRPYGGGPGMVLAADPVVRAIDRALSAARKGKRKTKVIILSPQGKEFTNAYAERLVKRYDDVVFVAGRYEGIDARVKTIFRAEEVSTGPYVLTGGELPALTMIDAMTRRIPGVLGKFESLEESRTASPDVYTRPEVYEWKGKKYRVPKVLRSGDHKKIDAWKETRIAMRKKKKGE